MNPAQELKSLIGSEAERQALGTELQAALPEPRARKLVRMLELIGWLLGVLEQKNLSIAKLKKLFFGARTEKAPTGERKPKKGSKSKGHGRNSHRTYTGARRVKVPHPSLRSGQECPDCKKGKLRPKKEPAIAITVTAQPPVGAVVHEMEQLRCDTCNKVFTAPTPAQAGQEKYDASVGVMAGLMRYGSGMPFYRLERLQKSLGVPFPASVQWEQVLRTSESLEPVLEQLEKEAAQASVLFSDDTGMRVRSLRQEIESEENAGRTGIFTTGIVGTCEEGRVSLFFTGREHAGENLAGVLEQREADQPSPIHMCDGLNRNGSKGHPTLEAQCNVHARRNFVHLEEYYPEECRKVLESFSKIYQVEARTKALGMSQQERLREHQEHSGPVIEELRVWFAELMDEKKVEPNSDLGKAIEYMQKRWDELTLFLRVPGAPLDNNEAERILKRCILHRKNSLHYRTERGARVGDVFMSVVETCRGNGVNPFDYMLAVVRNGSAVRAAPGAWMPWNYRERLAEQAAVPA